MHENTQMYPQRTSKYESENSIGTDQSLAAIQFARRLKRITAGIENFFQCQIERLESTLTHCQADVDRASELQRALVSFAQQKQTWEIEQATEAARLDNACAQLSEGWKLLENARRKWSTEKSVSRIQQTDQLHQPEEDSAWSSIESTANCNPTSQSLSSEMKSLEMETLRQAMLQHRNRNG